MENRKQIAKQMKEEFINRVNAEFGGKEEWEAEQRRIAQETGADSVYIHRDVMATKLAEGGFIVSPHIRRTRFMAKLRPQDVGLDPDNEQHKEFLNNYLTLGSKLLLPSETLKKLDRIDQRIRRLVDEEYGVPTCSGVFVPLKNIEPMMEDIKKLKAEYFAIRDSIIDNYESIRFSTEAKYREYAVEAYRLIRKDKWYYPTDEEIKTFVDNTMRYFPSKKVIYDSFYVNISFGAVASTEFLVTQEVRLRNIREREALFQQELRNIKARLTEEARLQREKEKIELQIQKERLETEIARQQAERRAIELAIEQAKKEHLPQMEQVFADLAGAVHGIVYETITHVTEALKTNGALRSADSKSLSTLVRKIKKLTVGPDADVERWLQQLQTIIDTPPQKRSVEDIREALDEIREQSAKTILSLGRVPRTLRCADIDMPDIEKALSELADRPRQPRQVRLFQAENKTESVQNKNIDNYSDMMRRPRLMMAETSF